MARSVRLNEEILSGGIYGQLICHLNPTCLCQLVRREVQKCSPVAVPRVRLYSFLHALPQPGAGSVLKRTQCVNVLINSIFIFPDILSAQGLIAFILCSLLCACCLALVLCVLQMDAQLYYVRFYLCFSDSRVIIRLQLTMSSYSRKLNKVDTGKDRMW